MAFDRSSEYQAAHAAEDVYRELGRAYIEPGAESSEFQVLDPRRAALLEVWGRALIPGDEEWPSAADVPFVGYVDSTLERAARLRPVVLHALDAVEAHAVEMLGRSFTEASDEERVAILIWFEASSPLEFTLIKELAYEVYYRDPTVARVVRERTGFDTRRPVDGIELDLFDMTLELLGEVAERPSIVREVTT